MFHKKYSCILEQYSKIEELRYNFSNLEFNDDSYCISLSGGVDSMVLLDILYKLNKKIIAIHINYNNRNESKLEEDFLKEYCQIKNIIFRCYLFNFKRGSINRTEYEKITKNIKFNFYKTILQEFNLKSILLAHHKDDIIENIFTNFCKGENFLNLSVIKYSNTILDINIIRPLIDFYKEDIYNYAHYFKIPYFLDTTPLWSVRGKFRNNLLKILINIFPGFKKNLLYISKESNDWSNLINEKFIDKYITNIELINESEKLHKIKLPLKTIDEDYRKFPICFWTIILSKIFHCIIQNINCPSRKSIELLIYNINNYKQTNMILKNNIKITLLKFEAIITV